MKRLLILEDDELVEDGYPVKAERGRYMDDFGEEQALELWASYGMKTSNLIQRRTAIPSSLSRSRRHHRRRVKDPGA